MLQAGARIASGQWPYRDFWINYPPGQPLVLAVLQEIFGASLLAWRVVAVAVDAGVALLAYRLARRRAPESYALGAWLAVASVMAFPMPARAQPARAAAGLRRAAGGAPAPRSGRRPRRPGVPVPLRDRASPRSPACSSRRPAGDAPARSVRRWRVRGGLAGAVLRRRARTRCGTTRSASTRSRTCSGSRSRSAFHGPLRPSKLIEFYIPLILVAGLALWALAMAVAIASRRPSAHASASMHGGIAARAAGAGSRPRGVVAGPAGAGRPRLPARAHRRVPPRPAGGGAAGDAGVGGGGGARPVAADRAARRRWR